jgi:hypothetical protein
MRTSSRTRGARPAAKGTLAESGRIPVDAVRDGSAHATNAAVVPSGDAVKLERVRDRERPPCGLDGIEQGQPSVTGQRQEPARSHGHYGAGLDGCRLADDLA